MLLRSIAKHVKEQNWFAVVLDFFIVVAGILIAFQITNWNEANQNRAKAELFLERLEQDFVGQLKRTSGSLASHKPIIEMGVQYYYLSLTCTVNSSSALFVSPIG